MFERYTEKARRVVFFARYEASQFGSPYIETEHLLLGLIREDKALTHRLVKSYSSMETIRKQVESRSTIREKVSTSIDLPLSNESKRVLAYAAEEAERLAHKHIGTEHLYLGLLREEKCFGAELLYERGLRLATAREEVVRTPSVATSSVLSVVAVGSTPAGADIEIDGAYLGSTPAELPLAVGERLVRLTKRDYQPWERRLQVVAGGKQNVAAELERSSS